MPEMLYHVGCGRPLFTRDEAKMMALSCVCGAYSPIVAPDLEAVRPPVDILPASMIRILGGGLEREYLPHWETYLGFSDFDCPAKRSWTALLTALGLTSQRDCDRRECGWAVERFVALDEELPPWDRAEVLLKQYRAAQEREV